MSKGRGLHAARIGDTPHGLKPDGARGEEGIKHQQNRAGRTIAVITVRAVNNRIETLTPLMPQVLALLPIVQPGQVSVIEAKPSVPAD